MRRPNVFPVFVQAIDVNVGGVIQDRAPVGTMIAGYMICLRGVNTGGAAVDPVANVGQIILRSALMGDLLTEPHAGFMVERSIQKKGNIRFENTGVLASAVDISMFHDFDISGDYSHGTVYAVLPGESLEWVMPAVAAGVMTGTWEIHRIEADTGNCAYISRWRARGLPVAEIGFTLDGRTAEIMLMPARGGGAVNPDRVSFFDPSNRREFFLSWNGGLAWTNGQFRYDADQATYLSYARFSDLLESVKNVFKSTQMRLEFTGGVGLVMSSYAILEEAPEAMRLMIERLSSETVRSAEENAKATGISDGAIGETKKTYAPISGKAVHTPEIPKSSTARTGRAKTVSIF